MTYLPRVAAASSAEWSDLVVELDRWEEAGLVARLWWRDDDAAVPSPNLGRLLTFADAVPLALAVVPADAVSGLVAALAPFPDVAVLQHGWCHANRGTSGKKCEYPAERHPVDVADELDEGRRHLRSLFGQRVQPVFVPPWNRFADRFVPLLLEAGFVAISRMAPRADAPSSGDKRMMGGGLAVIDVHIDIVAWHEGRKFVGESAALGQLVAELRARREMENPGAIGVLTHHLVMDKASEEFLGRLGDVVAGHGAVRWAGIPELIGAS